MMKLDRLVSMVALSVACVLAGCASSPPTRFYTLKAFPPAPRPLYVGPPLRMSQVQIPAILDRPQLVREPRTNELKVEEFYHWGAPLGQLVRNALTEDLQARSAAGTVLATGADKPNAVTLNVEILNITSSDSDVRMDVIWTATSTVTVAGKPATTSLSHTEHLVEGQSASSPEAYSAAVGALVGQLSDRIVDNVGQPNT